jgi:hypothetical protein
MNKNILMYLAENSYVLFFFEITSHLISSHQSTQCPVTVRKTLVFRGTRPTVVPTGITHHHVVGRQEKLDFRGTHFDFYFWCV